MSRKKILIVDDQPEVRELVSVTLEIGPYEIITASNGGEAIAMARDHKPDLMLLDIQMPGKYDGLEVCAELKNDVETSNIYIIMLTAKGQEWDKEAGWKAGCDEYYVKPFSPLELMSKVEQLLS